MQLSDAQAIFNRAFSLTFERAKWLLTFLILALSGLFVVFCRGLAAHANYWVAMSLTFLPIFLCSGILLALGVVLIRVYHDEVKKKSVNFRKIFAESWEIMLGASYFTVPIILIYLLLWMLLGIFLLLQNLPVIGEFFGVILAFAPFLLNLATLVLCAFVLGILFFVTPIIALKGLNRAMISENLIQKFKSDLFSNLLLFFIGLLPLTFYLGMLLLAVLLTGNLCTICNDSMQTVLQWFFIMIPFTAALSPAIIFFFNFAAEAHVLLQRKIKSGR